MQRTAFIINPNSSNGKYQSFLNKLNFLIDNPNIFISKSKKDTEDFINNNLNNIDIFVAVGGDGTISSIAKQLIYTDKILAVYPMGSGNGFAKENGFDNKSIKKLLTKIQNKKSKIIDTIKINQEFSINVSGVGLDSVVAYNFEKTSRGFFNYIKTTIATFFSFNDINIKFKNIDYQKYNGKYLMLNVANTRQFGNDAFIAPNAILDDGLVDIVLVKRFSLISSIKFAYQLFSKKLGGNPFVTYLRLEQIDLEIDNNIWHIDGDAMELPSPVEIQVLKHSLKVLK